MLGIKSRTTILRYVSGERRPPAAMIDKIAELTGGAVTQADFDDPSPPLCRRSVLDRMGRPRAIYPWTPVERQVASEDDGVPWPRKIRDMSQHRRRIALANPPPKVGRLEPGQQAEPWPSPPIRRAMQVLRDRVRLTKRGTVLLDGRISDFRRMVTAANEELRRRGQPPIPYPGVEPLL